MVKILKSIIAILLILNVCLMYNLIAHKTKDVNKMVETFYCCNNESQFHKYNGKNKLFVKNSAKNSLMTTFIKPYEDSSVVKYTIVDSNYDDNTIIVHSIITLDHNVKQEVLDTWEYNNGYITLFNRNIMEGV